MENSQSVDIEGFELLERLGGGSMGEVYRARDLNDGQIIALKLLILSYPATSPTSNGSAQRPKLPNGWITPIS